MKGFKITLVGTLAFAAMAFTTNLHDEVKEGLKVGDRAPMTNTEMKATDGKTYSLSGLNGDNGLIVVFSCNTCPFVVGGETFKGWEGQYNDLHKKAAEAGLGFVLINSNEAKREGDDSMDAMKKHASEKGYTMPYVVDEHSALANAFGAKTTPHVYFFNQKMELIYHGAIDNSVDTKRKEEKTYLLTAISEHAANGKITENNTPPRGCSIKRVAHAR